MHRRINFLSIIVLLCFATIFPVAIHAQDKFRLTRPTENNTQNNYPPNNYQLNADQTNQQNSQNDNSAFRINLKAKAGADSNQIKGNIEEDAQPGELSQVQLQKLASHDIILLIDKSGSMATPDCSTGAGSSLKSLLPSLLLGGVLGSSQNSRWQWCRREIAQMSNLTQKVLPDGFSVILFDSGSYVYPKVTIENLANIFARNNPGGSTNLAQPLNQVFNDYFKRQKISRVPIKPLLVGIITDGCPDSPTAVKRLIAETTHFLHDPNDITIVFFLIGGHDSEGERFARELSQNLAGASFNMVRYVPFAQVLRAGLARSLADNLQQE
jgi:Mg-chelatase subunit ChlD